MLPPLSAKAFSQEEAVRSAPAQNSSEKARRLSFKDQHELARLPKKIEGLEAELAELHQEMAAPDFFKRPGDLIAHTRVRINSLERSIADSYRRWEQLEAMAESSS